MTIALPRRIAELEYGVMTPDEAPLLVDLVRSCYGNDYVHAYFYQAERICELLAQKKLFSVVARTVDESGNKIIVAHMAIRIEYEGDRSADNFAGMMFKEYRGQGVLMKLGEALFPIYEQHNLIGLQTSTVTHHTYSQKISSNTGTVSCGCLFADSPGSNAEGLQINTRMPIIMQYFPFRTAAMRKLFVISDYQPLVTSIFNKLNFPLQFGASQNSAFTGESDFECHIDEHRGIGSLRFHKIGHDSALLIADFFKGIKQFASNALYARYLDVPLTDSAAILLTHAANQMGFFFGGIIFERADTDFLRLQWCELPPAESRKGIIEDFTCELVARILDDHKRVQKSILLERLL